MNILRISFMGLLLLGTAAEASVPRNLADIDSVKDALDRGASVAVMIDLGLCEPASAATKPTRTRGGRHIDAYRVTEDGTLAFADDHFTIDRDGEPIRQFLRYQVHQNGTATVSMTVFSMPNYTRVGPTLDFQCAINKGMRFVADGG